jgi:hypothetical protein
LALFICYTSYGQQIENPQCENQNAYFKTGNYETLQELVDTIHPNGRVYFNPAKVQEYGQESILARIGIQEETTFEFLKSSQSNFDERKVYRRFQQYYDGIRVEDGGYVVTSIIAGGGDPSVPGPGWDGPCDARANAPKLRLCFF